MASQSDALRIMLAAIAAMREAPATRKRTSKSSPVTPGTTSKPVATNPRPSATARTAGTS